MERPHLEMRRLIGKLPTQDVAPFWLSRPVPNSHLLRFDEGSCWNVRPESSFNCEKSHLHGLAVCHLGIRLGSAFAAGFGTEQSGDSLLMDCFILFAHQLFVSLTVYYLRFDLQYPYTLIQKHLCSNLG